MPIIQRAAVDNDGAEKVASAFDKHGIRVVAMIPPEVFVHLPPSLSPSPWLIFGQGEGFDCDEVDRTIQRMMEGLDLKAPPIPPPVDSSCQD